jgi:hypothetical protein
VLQDRGRAHDVEVRVLLAREGSRRLILCRRAGSHGVGGPLAQLRESTGDRRREIVRDGDPFDGPADLRTERADRLPVIRVHARQLIQAILDRRYFRHDPSVRVRRHAEAGRDAYALDPGQLPELRALAANERDLRRVDRVQIPHVLLDHCDTSTVSVLAAHRRPVSGGYGPRPTILRHDRGLAASSPPRCTLKMDGADAGRWRHVGQSPGRIT